MAPRSRFGLIASLAALAMGGCSGCNSGTAPTADSAALASAASASASAAVEAPPPWIGMPRQKSEVDAVINKSKREPYSGKTGTLTGRITMKGDPAPSTAFIYPQECAEAAGTYGRAFRVGQDDALADVLVTVTGYEAFVPAAGPVLPVKISGCAFDKRTYAMAFGQRIEVSNTDVKGSFMPVLDPSEYRAMNIALPKGSPVKIYAYQPGINYVLRDIQGKEFMQADVFVLKFATLDTTGLDGRYKISGIPVGKVQVNALLPVIDKSAKQEIEIKEGDNTLDLELTYSAKDDKIIERPASPWARGLGSAAVIPSSGKYGTPPAPGSNIVQ
ncbi:MAG: hypothetical protein JNK04_07260 [Myxococcales bacterium]|nr:hypothetical protein [Myxococcales bacterium]